MKPTEFIFSERFLKPRAVDLGDERIEFTRDFARALYLQFGEDEEDLFQMVFDDGGECTGNMSDFSANLFSDIIRAIDPMGIAWTDWMKSFREEKAKYSETGRPFVDLVLQRIPGLSEFEERDVFVRQLLGDLGYNVQLISWLESREVEIPPSLSKLWGFWLCGYWPCGFRGYWPSDGVYVLFDPTAP